MNTNWALVMLGAVCLIGLSRYLRHREVMRMLELGRSIGEEEDLTLQETWRSRSGFLVGGVMFVLGMVFVVLPVVDKAFRLGTGDLGDSMVLLGSVCAGVGLVIAVSYWVWLRQPIPVRPSSEGRADEAGSPEHGRPEEQGGA